MLLYFEHGFQSYLWILAICNDFHQIFSNIEVVMFYSQFLSLKQNANLADYFKGSIMVSSPSTRKSINLSTGSLTAIIFGSWKHTWSFRHDWFIYVLGIVYVLRMFTCMNKICHFGKCVLDLSMATPDCNSASYFMVF